MQPTHRASPRFGLTYKTALLLTFTLIVVLYLVPTLAGFPLWPGGASRSLAQVYAHTDDVLTFATGYRQLRSFIVAELTAGRLPLWMPYQMMGIPLLEQYEYQLLNPLEWPNWLGTEFVWSIVLVGQLVLAAAGTIAFCRRLGITPLGALAAAILFCGAGFTSHFYLTSSFVTAIPVIPWLLYCLWAVIDEDIRPRIVVGLVASIAGMLLGGQPQIAFCVAYFSGAFCVILIASQWKEKKRGARLIVMVAAVGLALLIAAPQIGPFGQLLTSGEASHTHELRHIFPKDGPRSLINLFNFVFPYSMGVAPYDVWIENAQVHPVASEDMPIGFFATGTLLVLVGLLSLRGSAVKLAVGGTFVIIFLTIILHGHVGLRVWPAGFVTLPRYSAPILAFLGAILAGLGVDAISNKRHAAIAALAVCGLAAVVVTYLMVNLSVSDVHRPEILWHVIVLNAISLASVAAMAIIVRVAAPENARPAIVLILAADVLWQFRYGFALNHDLVRLVPTALLFFAALLVVLRRAWASHAAIAAFIAQMILWAGHAALMVEPIATEPLPRMLLAGHRSVADVNLLPPNSSAAERLSSVSSRYPIQFKAMQHKFAMRLTDFRGFGTSATPWPHYCEMRATFAELAADTVVGYREHLDRLFDANPRCREDLILVSHTGPISIYRDGRAIPRAYLDRSGEKIPLTVADVSAQDVRVDVKGAGTGQLVLNDQYFSGWKAYVDGAPAQIAKVNGVARGVELDTPATSVRFVYDPPLMRWFVLSAIGFVGSILLAVAMHRYQRAANAVPPR